MPERRFPPPRTVEEYRGISYIVRDANKRSPAHRSQLSYARTYHLGNRSTRLLAHNARRFPCCVPGWAPWAPARQLFQGSCKGRTHSALRFAVDCFADTWFAQRYQRDVGLHQNATFSDNNMGALSRPDNEKPQPTGPGQVA
jgi:hypothetical protein